MDGGIAFIETRKRLDSPSETSNREVTKSSGVSCGESSSESVGSPASLKSQACPLPILPTEPQVILKDHPICADGNTVHNSSMNTRKEAHERIVATAPLSKYEDNEVVNTFVEMLQRLPWQLWPAQTLDAIVPCSQPRLQEQLLPS